MSSRMDRYYNEDSSTTVRSSKNASRTSKNRELYDDFYRNSKYTEFFDIKDKNVIDLSNTQTNYQTREGYHKMRSYHDVMSPVQKEKRELDEYTSLYHDENKVYDINSILQEAKKNRNEVDELEKKRKLHNTEYNILAGLNKEELERFREEKKRKIEELQKEESSLTSIIDTITSKTLTDDLRTQNSGLLSDLMPSDKSQTIVTKPIVTSDTIARKIEPTKKESSMLEGMDKSFYTKSMDLSDQDFEVDDDFKDVKEHKIVLLILKVILFIVLVAVVTIAIYYVINHV